MGQSVTQKSDYARPALGIQCILGFEALHRTPHSRKEQTFTLDRSPASFIKGSNTLKLIIDAKADVNAKDNVS